MGASKMKVIAAPRIKMGASETKVTAKPRVGMGSSSVVAKRTVPRAGAIVVAIQKTAANGVIGAIGAARPMIDVNEAIGAATTPTSRVARGVMLGMVGATVPMVSVLAREVMEIDMVVEKGIVANGALTNEGKGAAILTIIGVVN